MAFKLIDRLFVVAYGTVNVTDEEWMHYLRVVEGHGIERTAQLIFTAGGGPSSKQCKYLNDLLAGRSPKVAVVSASADIRGVVTALSWFNRNIRAFHPTDLCSAIDYLGIPPRHLKLIEREANAIKLSISEEQHTAA